MTEPEQNLSATLSKFSRANITLLGPCQILINNSPAKIILKSKLTSL